MSMRCSHLQCRLLTERMDSLLISRTTHLIVYPLIFAVGVFVVHLVSYWLLPIPVYFSDSGTYLHVAYDLLPPRDRPAGVAWFWIPFLSAWPSVHAVVISHILLTAVMAGLAVSLVREIGASNAWATLAGIAVAFAPTTFLSERMVMAEQLAAALVLLFAYLVVRQAVRDTVNPWGGAALGLSLAALALTRTAFLPLLVSAAPLAMLTLRANWKARTAYALALTLSLTLPLAGYAYLSHRTLGTASLSPWSPYPLFARVAEGVDCSDWSKPPEIRREICEAGIPSWEYEDIVWLPGPVNSRLTGETTEFLEGRDQLRELAQESIRREPTSFASEALYNSVAVFSAYDPDFRALSTTPMSWVTSVMEARGISEAEMTLSPSSERQVFSLISRWYVIRRIAFAGALLTLLGLIVRGTRRYRIAALVLLLSLSATIFIGAALGGPFPRYLYPFEPLAWTLTFTGLGLLVRRLRPHDARRLKLRGLPSPGGTTDP